MAIKTLEIGALGIQHEGWLESYYPEDLPEDWRLDYYSHHFNVALLPVDEWLSVTEDDLAQWTEDVKDEFQFLLAIDNKDINTAAIEQISLIKTILKEHFSGVVVKVSDENLTTELQTLREISPVFADGVKLSGSDLATCWRKQASIENSVLGFITEQDAGNLREVRACVEAFLAQCQEHGTCYLIFEGASPSTKMMQDTQVVIQMLT